MAPVALAGRVDARTVLLDDDDEDFRVALAEALDEEGYVVVAVPNAAAALAARRPARYGAGACAGAASLSAYRGRRTEKWHPEGPGLSAWMLPP